MYFDALIHFFLQFNEFKFQRNVWSIFKLSQNMKKILKGILMSSLHVFQDPTVSTLLFIHVLIKRHVYMLLCLENFKNYIS